MFAYVYDVLTCAGDVIRILSVYIVLLSESNLCSYQWYTQLAMLALQLTRFYTLCVLFFAVTRTNFRIYEFAAGSVRHIRFFKIFLKMNIVGVGIMILRGPYWNFSTIISQILKTIRLQRFCGKGSLLKWENAQSVFCSITKQRKCMQQIFLKK